MAFAPSKEEMAALWLSTFPQKAYDLVRKQKLPAGTRIVSVQSELSTPTCKDRTVSLIQHDFFMYI